MKHIRRFDRVFEEKLVKKILSLAKDDREVMDSIQEITDTLGHPTYSYNVDFEYFKWNLNISETNTELTREQFEKFTSIITDLRDNAIQAAYRLSERYDVKFNISHLNLIIILYPKNDVEGTQET